MKQDTFAARLRALLDEAGITAYRLAEDSGIPKATIHRYLHGKREPTLKNAAKIAKTLGKRLTVFE